MHTENPLRNDGRDVHVSPWWKEPVGPAPRTSANDSTMMIKKITILIKDVTYSNQAKTLFGSMKITRQATRNIVT